MTVNRYTHSPSVRGAAVLALLSAVVLVPAPPAHAAGRCVANPQMVATRTATSEMTRNSLPAAQVAKLDAAARAAFEQAASPGAIIGVRSPAGTWTAAYGKADVASGAPMAVGMQTRIGSMTKTFIATLVMQLEEKGVLSLDDPISKYVAGIPNGDQVTLRLLANMTSGVASYTFNPKWVEIFETHPETVYTPEQLVQLGVENSPAFAPGARYDYSNTNYILLGMAIEKATGQPVDTVLKTMIFDRLGLKNTVWPGASTDMPQPFARGYTLEGKPQPAQPVDATNWNPSWTGAAGGLISNMEDLLVYGRAVGTGQGLVKAETQVKRLTSFPEPPGIYGIGLACKDGWIGHQGELAGYNTTVFYDTVSDTTIVVQANSNISSGNCKDTATLSADPRKLSCSTPAMRMFIGLTGAIGRPIQVTQK
jgi:D-alanyl-D-alanine carboxypeptidase